MNDMGFYQKNFVLCLGTWHPYKVACEKVFHSFLESFFGPVLHSIMPNSTVHAKPRLVHLEDIFSIISCAYPSFRGQLLGLENSLQNLPNRYASDIHNLVDLFEFYLPLVIFLIVYFGNQKALLFFRI